LNLAWGIDRMRNLGVKIDGVRLVGGGSKNPLWASILADAIGVPVSRLAEAESAALGAALQALWTARRSTGDNPRLHDLASPLIEMRDEPIEPDPERVAFYADLGEAFRAAVEKQFGD
ncbi:MAG: FGGY-family carbohydrate kinase, partial [Planctomycetota bacterium]|nr:FGGY-family carbohydrate kinase [Planctomycetota bacterium]